MLRLGKALGEGGPTRKSDLGALPKALLPQGMVGSGFLRAGESASPILCTSSKSGLRFERPASQAYEAGDRKLGSPASDGATPPPHTHTMTPPVAGH